MPDPFDSTADEVPLEIAKQIDAISDEFEAALNAGLSPSIAAYAKRAPEKARRAMLRELARLELDSRHRRGDPHAASLAQRGGGDRRADRERLGLAGARSMGS